MMATLKMLSLVVMFFGDGDVGNDDADVDDYHLMFMTDFMKISNYVLLFFLMQVFPYVDEVFVCLFGLLLLFAFLLCFLCSKVYGEKTVRMHCSRKSLF